MKRITQLEGTYIAKTFQGLEEVLENELKSLGINEVERINRGVKFTGDEEAMYRVCYGARTALRVLRPIFEFRVESEKDLYDGAMAIDWPKIFSSRQTFAVDSVISYAALTHSKFVALKVKDAIADRFRNDKGLRPNVDTEDPDIRINVHLFRNMCSISLDASGSSLHLRGWRQATVQAPISEVLASGMLLLAGYDGSQDLIDPMCGSGTILIEAAMIAQDIPPGKFRKKFGFETWKTFDPGLWHKVKMEFDRKEKLPEAKILGFDMARRAIISSRQNIRNAGFHRAITVTEETFDRVKHGLDKGMIVTNPPYGERMHSTDITELYQSMGDTLKHNFDNFTAWMISADLEALKFVGLKPSKKIKLFNGKLECRFVKFDIYSLNQEEQSFPKK